MWRNPWTSSGMWCFEWWVLVIMSMFSVTPFVPTFLKVYQPVFPFINYQIDKSFRLHLSFQCEFHFCKGVQPKT